MEMRLRRPAVFILHIFLFPILTLNVLQAFHRKPTIEPLKCQDHLRLSSGLVPPGRNLWNVFLPLGGSRGGLGAMLTKIIRSPWTSWLNAIRKNKIDRITWDPWIWLFWHNACSSLDLWWFGWANGRCIYSIQCSHPSTRESSLGHQ